MKYIYYALIGFSVYGLMEFLSINLGTAIGAGFNEIGLVVTAISLQTSIMVICTIIVVNKLKN